MKILALALLFQVGIEYVAILPQPIEVPTVKQVKKSRGKGKGSKPYFAKFL